MLQHPTFIRMTLPTDGRAGPLSRAVAFLQLFAFLTSVLTAVSTSAAERPSSGGVAEKRVALVIGNNAYPSAALRNPVNDATAIAKKLQDLGFEVMIRTNVSQREMTRAIGEFGEKIAIGSVALFYYAGHGIQARGKNFLVPVDAEIKSEGSVSTESVDVERVLDQLSPARLSMVVLDACRNNPFERRFRSGFGAGLAQIDAPAGTLIAYATAPGKVAQDGDGTNGPYTRALLDAIETPGLRVEDVFKQVRIQVLKTTKGQQIPWESSSLTGEFLFRPGKTAVPDTGQNKLEQDLSGLRDSMAVLSAQISKLNESRPTGPSAQKNEQEQKRVEQDTAALREQVATLNAEISRMRQSQAPAATAAQKSDPERRKLEADAAELRDRTALLNAEISRLRANQQAPSGAAASYAADWKEQLAKVAAAGTSLTLATAMEKLLDVTAPDDVAVLKRFATQLSRRPYNAALALGVDANGFIVWGGGHTHATRPEAGETALQFCTSAEKGSCKVVVVNGDFAREAWLEALKPLGSEPVNSVRAALMASLRQPIIETAVGLGPRITSSVSATPPTGYTFARR